MNTGKRMRGLLGEDLKSKLGLFIVICYVLGMFCLLFSMKMTIPQGEMRSLYVGAGNTSFFVAMIVFGFIAGAASFRFLYSEPLTDLYFSLPFRRTQLFLAGYWNNFLIFALPVVLCKLLFFRISLSMGYCEYESSVFSAGIGCVVLILGFLFVMSLSMLAFLLAQNTVYRIGLLLFFWLGPAAGLHLAESTLRILIPSFYREEILEALKGYLIPLTLLEKAAGVRDYVDASYWMLEEYLPYLWFLGIAVLALFLVNLTVFCLRPAERGSGMFTFGWVEGIVRYGCMILVVLWFVDGLHVFSVSGFSYAFTVIGVIAGVPAVHGLLNMALAFDAKRFLSAKWHLLAEFLVMILVFAVFAAFGKRGGEIPDKAEVKSAAVILTALSSGDDSEQALQNMKLTGTELSESYDWLKENCAGEKSETYKNENDSYEILVKFELENGRNRYFKYQLPERRLNEFGEIYEKQGYKQGTYEALRLNSVKYYEIQWSNGLQSYTLDLTEEERQQLWERYSDDLKELDFAGIRGQVPMGKFTFVSTKNQGDVTGYIYPEFSRAMTYMSQLGIDADKRVSDYELLKIIERKYMFTDGLLYDVRYLESERIITDPSKMTEMSQNLFVEEFCMDDAFTAVNKDTEYIVYYRDSEGRTRTSVKCLAGK